MYAVGLSGARERAFLVRVSSQLCRVRWNEVLPIALAAELFIASAFTSDDVLDCAPTRWKKATVWKRSDSHQAWLVAETLHALAQLSLSTVQPATAAPLRAAFNRLIVGQFAQIQPEDLSSTQRAIELARERTGALIQACLVAPAIMADEPLRQSLATFGINFGTAFQLVDDIRDFLGAPSRMGKPILGDILNGQPNIVLAHALRQKDSHSKQEVTRWVGKGTKLRPGDATAITEALNALGSIEYARGVVKQYINGARKALDGISEGRPKAILEGFLHLISPVPAHDEQS